MSNLAICLDGCGLEYLAKADTPVLDSLARVGRFWNVKAVVPTVTNVNNVSIVTASYPDRHGITGNYCRSQTGTEQYMESADFLLCPTLFEQAAGRGRKSAIVTAKDKLRTLLSKGTHVSVSAEAPPKWLIDLIGPPPSLYTIEANWWLLDAVPAIVKTHPELELIYVATTDFAMHRYPPEHPESQRHLFELDKRIGRLMEELDSPGVVVTADHGMSAKSVGLDPAGILGRAGIPAQAIPIIKDRHVVHHQNLGGAAYVYLDKPESAVEALQCLKSVPGIEAVLTRKESASTYHLHPDRIGDLMLLGDSQTVFGEFPEERMEVQVRSHGSLHEQVVPLIAYGNHGFAERPEYNKDLLTLLLPDSREQICSDRSMSTRRG